MNMKWPFRGQSVWYSRWWQ